MDDKINSTTTTATVTTNTAGKVSSSPGENGNLAVTVGSIIGGIVVIALIILLVHLYVKRRRTRQQVPGHVLRKGNKSPDSDDDVETGQLNPGLDMSSSDIYKPQSKVSTGAYIEEQLTEFEHEIDNTDENMVHIVSLKLLKNWSDIYTMVDTQEYKTMKQLVEASLETIYVSYDGFESVTLLEFRKGSVIADVQLTFNSNAVEPLSILENAIQCGKCDNLELDENYFKIITIDKKTVDGFTRKETFQVPKRNNRESGYYGGSEEDDLNLHKPSKNHSAKSTMSRDSMTSEVDSSYVSSTNISINSGAEDEGEGHVNIASTRTKTGHLPRFSKSIKSKNELSSKNNLIIGQLHKAKFDFQPESARELKLTKGDIVTVKAINAGGWAKAVNEKNQVGWIPQYFVLPFEVEKDDTKTTNEATMLLDNFINTLDGELTSTDDEDEGEDDETDSNDKLFIAIFPFDSSEKNELQLEVGDLIDVMKTDETGWWKGHCLRTEQDGWFPSSYVKPFIPPNEKPVLSDSEVMKRADSLDKPLSTNDGKLSSTTDGYSSDKGHTITKVPKDGATKVTMENDHESCDEDVKLEEKEEENKDQKKNIESNVILRTKKGAKKERTLSLIIDTKSSSLKYSSPAPLTPPPRLSTHIDHGTEKTFANPPSKPVPPKPRQKHIEKEYHNLVASGKLGSQDSLKTVSTECLSSLHRSSYKRRSGRRRNSEEIFPSQIERVMKRYNEVSKIHRIRPKSFQESSFLYLANRYANMKPAFSLPSLTGDQVKLSPDDDRPFHDPIPRRAKSHTSIDSKTPNVAFLDRNCSSLKDLSESDKKPTRSKYSLDYRDKQSSIEGNQSPLTSSSNSSLHLDTVDDVHNKTLPPEPELLTDLPPMMSHLLANKNLRASPLIAHKPSVPPRGSSKNKAAIKLIEEQRAKQGSFLPEHHYQSPRSHVSCGRLRQQKHFSSFESINEESEQGNTPKDEAAKLPGEHDHRRSRSEPHDRILQNEMVHFTLPPQMNNEQFPLPLSPTNIEAVQIEIPNNQNDQTLANHSRASSMLSLASVASSARSTASSKHEQQNLRRAIMDVHGQGKNDLSFKTGAILYEIYPRNKKGLCYGILDDSQEGWYPAESVDYRF